MPPEEIIVLGVCSYLGLGLGNINQHRFPLLIHFITKFIKVHPSPNTTLITRQRKDKKLTKMEAKLPAGCGLNVAGE